jgi:hypothetical protein
MRRIAATLAVVALLFSAGATLADDTDEANELFVEAVKLLNSAENIEDPIEKSDALEEALRKLNEIVDDYQSSGWNLTFGTVQKGQYPRQAIGSWGTQALSGNH